MNNLKPCFLIDYRHSIATFFLMFSAIFIISGTLAIYIKEAIWGFGILIFLVSLIVVSTVRSTDKTLPRFIGAGDDSLKIVYWDKKEKIVPFQDITQFIVDGFIGRSVQTIITIKTKDDVIKVEIEIFDSAVDIIACLKDKIDIEYKNKALENMFKNNIIEPWRKKFRIAFAYFWVTVFWVIAIALCFTMPSMVH